MMLYMLREHKTRRFLPDMGVGRGHTWSELVEPTSGHVPRFFATSKAAATALTWWKKGAFEADTYTDDDWAGRPVTVKDGIRLSSSKKHRENLDVRVRMVELDI